MRILITGSRDWRNTEIISGALVNLPSGTVIVHGCASGADAIARAFAIDYGLIPEDHWPDYANHPVFDAPKIRNQEMVDAGADHCYAFPTPNSRGTWDCVKRVKEAKIPLRIYYATGVVVDE